MHSSIIHFNFLISLILQCFVHQLLPLLEQLHQKVGRQESLEVCYWPRWRLASSASWNWSKRNRIILFDILFVTCLLTLNFTQSTEIIIRNSRRINNRYQRKPKNMTSKRWKLAMIQNIIMSPRANDFFGKFW